MLAQTPLAQGIDELRAKLGLDRPFHVQYVEWIGRAARGDLGESLWTRRPVVQELGQRLPVTAELALYATLIALLIAVPVGVLAAARQDSLSDYVVRSLAILGLSVPGFWLATLLIVLPAIWWGWRPVARAPGRLGPPAAVGARAPAAAAGHGGPRPAPGGGPPRPPAGGGARRAAPSAGGKPLGAIGGVIVVAMLVMAVFAEQIAPYR